MKSTTVLQVLPRLMVEIIVIVVGILLALWVDAYWEERKDRQQERVALATIHAEFLENKKRFDLAFDHHTRINDSLEQVLNATALDCNEEFKATINEAVFAWHTFNPVAGATQSLISSGRLGLISDQAIRVRLASWSGLYSDLGHDEIRTVEARDRVADYIAREHPDLDCAALVEDETFMFLLVLRRGEEIEVLTDNDQIPESIQLIIDATNPENLQ